MVFVLFPASYISTWFLCQEQEFFEYKITSSVSVFLTFGYFSFSIKSTVIQYIPFNLFRYPIFCYWFYISFETEPDSPALWVISLR